MFPIVHGHGPSLSRGVYNTKVVVYYVQNSYLVRFDPKIIPPNRERAWRGLQVQCVTISTYFTHLNKSYTFDTILKSHLNHLGQCWVTTGSQINNGRCKLVSLFSIEIQIAGQIAMKFGMEVVLEDGKVLGKVLQPPGYRALWSLSCASFENFSKQKFSGGGSPFWTPNLDLERPWPHDLLEPWS